MLEYIRDLISSAAVATIAAIAGFVLTREIWRRHSCKLRYGGTIAFLMFVIVATVEAQKPRLGSPRGAGLYQVVETNEVGGAEVVTTNLVAVPISVDRFVISNDSYHIGLSLLPESNLLHSVEGLATDSITNREWRYFDAFPTAANQTEMNLELRKTDFTNLFANAGFFRFALARDSDGDGLSDRDEINVHGTDPGQPDSDGDGLPDGWEIARGMDPKVADSGICDSDADRDGLTLFDESRLGTDPDDPDTDGDGIPDGVEVPVERLVNQMKSAASRFPFLMTAKGSGDDNSWMYALAPKTVDVGFLDDVTNPMDRNNDAYVAVGVMWGDPSYSCSEKYRIVFTPVSGERGTPSVVARTNAEYGECETLTVFLRKGWEYRVTVDHVATRPSQPYDPDYMVTLAGNLKKIAVSDHGLLGGHSDDYGSFAGVGASATIMVADDRDFSPKLMAEPQLFRFSIKMPQAELDSMYPELTIVGEMDPSKSYRVAAESVPPGFSGTVERIYPDGSSAHWRDSLTNVATVVYNLYENGAVIDSATCVYYESHEKEKCDTCCCGDGTQADLKCVSFSQKFGRALRVPGVYGRIVVSATHPSVRLYTPAALEFDHPVMRRIRTIRGLDAVIVDGCGEATEYRSGRPSGPSSGHEGQIYYDAETNLVEVLPSRLRLVYGPAGSPIAFIPENGTRQPVSEFGVTVERASSGAISTIMSVTDGRIDVSATGAVSWRAAWTAPSGAFVKRFDFGGNGSDVFTLGEYRSEEYSFAYRWTYDSDEQDWIFEKGVGSDDALRESKTTVWDADSGSWIVTHRCEDADGTELSSEISVIGERNGALRTTGVIRDGKTLYSAETDGGFVAEETDSLGARTVYRRDRFGRVVASTRNGGMLRDDRRLEYSYLNGVYRDSRPVREERFLNGVPYLVTETERGTNSERVVRTSATGVRVSSAEYDGFGRVTLRVAESGRATRTAYEDGDGSSVETEDTGVVGEAGFVLVDGKSTREVRTIDCRGDVVRRETYAYANGGFRMLGWETRQYSAAHRVIASAYSNGTSDAADWICPGPTWKREADGIVTSNRYSAAKTLAASTRFGPFGAVTTEYLYDGEGRVVREETTSPGLETRVVSRTYDCRGRITSETDPLGATTTYAYSDDDLTTTETRADGGTKVTTLHTDGSLRSVTGSAVTPEFHTYGITQEGLRWTCIRYGREDSPRFRTVYENGFGETVREERSGCNGSVIATEYVYDDFGELVGVIEDGQPEKRYAYDEFGDRIATVLAADDVSRYTSNETAFAVRDGQVWRDSVTVEGCSDSAIPPRVTRTAERMSGLSLDGFSESYSVDVRGNTNRQWSVFDPAVSTLTEYRISPGIGNVASKTSTDGAETESVSFSAVTNRVEYDAFRRETVKTDGRGNRTEYRQLSSGLLLGETDPVSNTTWTVCDNIGRVIAVTNALGEVTRYRYDARGNRVYEGGATYPVSYVYDTYGSRISMTTYRSEASCTGDTTHWLYEEASGVMTNKVYADGKGPCYEYDDCGRLAKRTWARGIDTFYAYDGWGNLANTTYSDATPTVALAYDALGRQTRAVDAAGVTTFAYDDFGANTNETVVGVAGTNTIERFYDTLGRDVGYALNGVRQSAVVYCPATGRLATMQAGECSNVRNVQNDRMGDAGVFTWSYVDGSDLKSSLAYPNGLNVSWIYDANDRLLQVENATSSSGEGSPLPSADVISKYVYSYDAAGRRIACAKSGSAFDAPDTNSYLYNARSELTNATAAVDSAYRYAYDFDDIGNREAAFERGMNFTCAANGLNQYTMVGRGLHAAPSEDVFSPVYDDDGNQTLVKTATGIWQVTYNGENRPVHWTQDDTVITMTYDRMGRRVTKNDQRFVYNGYLQIADNSGNNYIWDPTEPVATRPLAWNFSTSQPSTSQLLFYTHDGNKNVSEVIALDGTLAAHYEYAPFGALTVSRGESVEDNPWRFSSEFADDELSCDYFNYRHYEPMTGRWMIRDHAGDVDSLSLYAFVKNSPINEIDVMGLACQSTVWGFYCFNAPDPDDWYDSLPNCPCCIEIGGSTPNGPTGPGWGDVKRANSQHPGATWEVRWVDPDGKMLPGQQCTYDEDGKLITEPPAAGTPDMASFDDDKLWASHPVLHFAFDLVTYWIYPGDYYFRHWPPNNGNNCPKNAGKF